MRRQLAAPRIFHFSYHKCLTVFYGRILSHLFADSRIKRIFNRTLGIPTGYSHFNSRLERFYGRFERYRACSLNNHLIDFTRLGDYRASHFIRDPRDLVVSGYFYHRRGAEGWCLQANPRKVWPVVNGTVPSAVPKKQSLSEYLLATTEEDGLIAEIEFRKKHFEAMEAWDYSNPNCLEIRYEEVVGNERAVFRKMFEHYGLSQREISRGLDLADQYSVNRTKTTQGHIRDPKPGQWRERFTPRVTEAFHRQHPTLLKTLGYESETPASFSDRSNSPDD